MTDTSLLIGDCRDALRALPDAIANCVVTSPPYFGLRDYGVGGQIGMEDTPQQFVNTMVEVFRSVRRVLRDDGTLWLNLGDSYGAKKQLLGIPWRVALALQADGWHLRQDIIWHKPNVMPEPAKDRCVKSHEYIFLLSKSPTYHFDFEAIREPEVCGRMRGPALHPDSKSTNGNGGLARRVSDGKRNKRSVWSVNTKPFKEAHFATYPPELIEPCIIAGCPEGGTVLDPFFGSGTTGIVAERLGRKWIGCELSEEYAEIARRRLGIIDLQSAA